MFSLNGFSSTAVAVILIIYIISIIICNISSYFRIKQILSVKSKTIGKRFILYNGIDSSAIRMIIFAAYCLLYGVPWILKLLLVASAVLWIVLHISKKSYICESGLIIGNFAFYDISELSYTLDENTFCIYRNNRMVFTSALNKISNCDELKTFIVKCGLAAFDGEIAPPTVKEKTITILLIAVIILLLAAVPIAHFAVS